MDKEEEIEDPDSIDVVTEEFMMHLAWAVTDAQVEEKHFYHYSSPEHFIHDCPLVRASRENTQLNCKERGGDGIEEGSPDPSDEDDNAQEPSGGGSQGVT